MEKKKILWILGAVLAVLAILLMVLLPGQEPAADPSGPGVTVQSGLHTTSAPQPSEPEPTQTGPIPSESGESLPDETEPEQTRPEYTEPEQTEPPVYNTVKFPVELEGGKLTVQSLFQFSGMNPDADNAEGENIAGIQLTNTSDQHLREAKITAVLADGTGLDFRIQDLPAGMSAMIFATDNEPVDQVESCEDIYGLAEFGSADPRRPDLVEITENGMEITVRNVSGRTLNDLNVYCHSLLDGSCFGGVTYCYNIDSLSAGQSATVYAWDCILGESRVVRVELGD